MRRLADLIDGFLGLSEELNLRDALELAVRHLPVPHPPRASSPGLEESQPTRFDVELASFQDCQARRNDAARQALQCQQLAGHLARQLADAPDVDSWAAIGLSAGLTGAAFSAEMLTSEPLAALLVGSDATYLFTEEPLVVAVAVAHMGALSAAGAFFAHESQESPMWGLFLLVYSGAVGGLRASFLVPLEAGNEFEFVLAGTLFGLLSAGVALLVARGSAWTTMALVSRFRVSEERRILEARIRQCRVLEREWEERQQVFNGALLEQAATFDAAATRNDPFFQEQALLAAEAAEHRRTLMLDGGLAKRALTRARVAALAGGLSNVIESGFAFVRDIPLRLVPQVLCYPFFIARLLVSAFCEFVEVLCEAMRRIRRALRGLLGSTPLAGVAALAVVFFALVVSCGCAPSSGPAHLEILLDQSGSMRACGEDFCDEDVGVTLVKRFSQINGIAPRTRVSVHVVGKGGRSPRLFSGVVSRPSGGEGSRAVRERFEKQVADALAVEVSGAGSEVLEAIWAAGDRLTESSSKSKHLWAVTDLRDLDPSGNWYLGTRLPPADQVVAGLRERKAIPDLSGVDVRVCGFHRDSTDADWSPEKHHQLRAIGRAFFDAAGATGAVIQESCDF